MGGKRQGRLGRYVQSRCGSYWGVDKVRWRGTIVCISHSQDEVLLIVFNQSGCPWHKTADSSQPVWLSGTVLQTFNSQSGCVGYSSADYSQSIKLFRMRKSPASYPLLLESWRRSVDSTGRYLLQSYHGELCGLFKADYWLCMQSCKASYLCIFIKYVCVFASVCVCVCVCMHMCEDA